jgi:hypothetical protein
MQDPQKVGRLCAALFIITWITSIPALILYDPIIKDGGYASYLAGSGEDNQILFAAFLEVILILANIASALVLVPLLRKTSEILTFSYVAWRIVESTFILVGILAVLAVVTLRQDAGADAAGTAQALVAVKDWTFLLGPGFMVGVGNGMTLGYLLYKSGLIPRRLALVGIVAGPLVCISGVLAMFDVLEPGGAAQILFTLPEMIWEGLIIGVYVLVKGFRTERESVEAAPALAV